jgi:hypothetical protein
VVKAPSPAAKARLKSRKERLNQHFTDSGTGSAAFQVPLSFVPFHHQQHLFSVAVGYHSSRVDVTVRLIC